MVKICPSKSLHGIPRFSFCGISRILFLHLSWSTNFPGALVSPFFQLLLSSELQVWQTYRGISCDPTLCAPLSQRTFTNLYMVLCICWRKPAPPILSLLKHECQLDTILGLVAEGIPFYLLWFYLFAISKAMAWKKQGHLLTNIMGGDLALPHDLLFQCKDTLRHGLAVVCPSTIQSCHVTLKDINPNIPDIWLPLEEQTTV